MIQTGCDCSVIIPTRDRPRALGQTLERLHALPDQGFEVIVIDNDSRLPLRSLQRQFPQARWIELDDNLCAAARNVGAVAAEGRLLLMLDDDSWPMPGTIDRAVRLFDERLELGAAGCRVRLAEAPHRHDLGGLPGVIFNCGGFVRRAAFLESGGYPIDYDYYVEEYALCCELWRRGWRVEPQGELIVHHARETTGRDLNRILRLLVRNNVRLWRRYAPEGWLEGMIDTTLDRCMHIARKARAMNGYRAGVEEARREEVEGSVRRTPLSRVQFDDLFGLGAAESALRVWADNGEIGRVAVWSRGKGCEMLLKLLDSACIVVEAIYDDDAAHASTWKGRRVAACRDFSRERVDGIVVGSLSPGAAADLAEDLAARYRGVPVFRAVEWGESQRAEAA